MVCADRAKAIHRWENMRDFMPWMKKYEVGHKELDAEHRNLVAAINKISAAESAGVARAQLELLLIFFTHLAENHLRSEDSILRRINSGPLPQVPDRHAFLNAMVGAAIAEHLVSHSKSRSRLNEIVRSFRPGGSSTDSSLAPALKSWFIDHALGYDARLWDVFNCMGSA